MSDIRAGAEAELREIGEAFEITSHRLVKAPCGQRNSSYVTWNGREIRLTDYVAEKLAVLSQWEKRWRKLLTSEGVAITYDQDPDGGDVRVWLHDEGIEPGDDPDPWKPEADPVESSATELQRIALYKPVPTDTRWTLARIASDYPEQCAGLLKGLTQKQHNVAKAYLYDGLSQWETANRCGISNPQRVSEIVKRIRERFERAGLPRPQPPLPREQFDPYSDDDIDDMDTEGPGDGPYKMLPEDPEARRRLRR